jgi:hypothetical protein
MSRYASTKLGRAKADYRHAQNSWEEKVLAEVKTRYRRHVRRFRVPSQTSPDSVPTRVYSAFPGAR